MVRQSTLDVVDGVEVVDGVDGVDGVLLFIGKWKRMKGRHRFRSSIISFRSFFLSFYTDRSNRHFFLSKFIFRSLVLLFFFFDFGLGPGRSLRRANRIKIHVIQKKKEPKKTTEIQKNQQQSIRISVKTGKNQENPVKPSQTQSNQVKPSQTQSNPVKPSRTQ